jgi:hypothetical protein
MNKHPEWIFEQKFGRYTYATDGQTGIYVKKDNEDWKITAKIAKNSYFLASGGRDCIIHLYDVERCSYGVLLIG